MAVDGRAHPSMTESLKEGEESGTLIEFHS